MATPNYAYEKRQKELAKKQKQQQKQQQKQLEKAEIQNERTSGGTPPAVDRANPGSK